MRVNNWQNNLSRLIEENRDKPFDFAEFNCVLWASKGVEAVTGRCPHEPGEYKNEIGAKKWLKKHGFEHGKDLLVSELGIQPQPIGMARIGDIVFADHAIFYEDYLASDLDLFGPVPGICYGNISFFVGERGLITLNTLSLAETLWVL